MNSKTESTVSSKLLHNKQKTIDRFLLPLLKSTAFIVGPVFGALCVGLYINNPCWQFLIVMVGMLITASMYVFSWRISIKMGTERGTVFSTVSTFFLVSVVICLVEGLLGLMLVALISSTIQVSVFSKKYVVLFLIWTGIAYASATLFQHFELFETLKMSPGVQLGVDIGSVLFLLAQTGKYIMNGQNINNLLFSEMERSNHEQNKAIETVNEIRPVIAEAIESIETISTNFASQASEQAAATAQVNATVSEVMQIVGQSARSASDAVEIAAGSEEGLQSNNRRLEEVVEGFEDVVQMIEISRTEIVELAGSIEQIEQILGKNRAIGEHIKVLAVNASIEAAKAGELGRGFNVVARELRDMIQATELNLSSSWKLLDEIRNSSNTSTGRIKEGSEKLARYYVALQNTGRLMQESAVSFRDTAERVQVIAHSANEQQLGMKEIGTTMAQLDTAAAQLDSSSSLLIDAVQKISASQSDLHNAFE